MNSQFLSPLSQDHARFLDQRRAGLAQLETLIRQQAGTDPTPAPPVYTRRQLEAFATGRISDCFGDEYRVFDGQRVPRIPSGELLLMSRVAAVEGTRRNFSLPASIRTEFDVSPADWFVSQTTYSGVAYAALMEMALQPCGLLSAYLGTMFLFPTGPQAKTVLFRNLDGRAVLLKTPDLNGRTVTAQARLLAHTAGGGTIIQKYAFELSCAGEVFYRGESTFGYFDEATMQAQRGLDPAGGDAGASRTPAATQIRAAVPPAPASPPAGSHLDLLDEIGFDPAGAGRVSARRTVRPGDWFYRCHFLGDPVMPGSLGVEAMLQALQAYGTRALGRQAEVSLATNRPLSWKYRGQITPGTRTMSLELHVTQAEPLNGSLDLSADASLWADGLRIYEVKGLGMKF